MSTILLWVALFALTALFLAALVVRGTRRRVFHEQPVHPYRARASVRRDTPPR
jgi:hypothetical protein